MAQWKKNEENINAILEIKNMITKYKLPEKLEDKIEAYPEKESKKDKEKKGPLGRNDKKIRVNTEYLISYQ